MDGATGFIFFLALVGSAACTLYLIMYNIQRAKNIKEKKSKRPPTPEEIQKDREIINAARDILNAHKGASDRLKSLNAPSPLQEAQETIKKKNEIIDTLRIELDDIKRGRQTVDEIHSDERPREALRALHEEYLSLQDENAALQASLNKLEADNAELKHSAQATSPSFLGYDAADITHILERNRLLEDQLAQLEHLNISSARNDAWNDLQGNRFHTLSALQREQIHFPRLNPECVYYLPSHNTFHAVNWCYALGHSPAPKKITLEAARKMNLSPCSKCVEEIYYSQ